MLQTAIIGCGKIADQHVQAIARIPNCKIVAVCDREASMAEQLAERFEIPACFEDVESMLQNTHPEVVHITTPPQSHFELGRLCLNAGSHVYLEKPFTVTSDEAKALIELAKETGLKLTAGHNLQFTSEMLAMRRLIQEGFLGGPPLHLESHFSYSLDDTSFVGPLLGSRDHWVRKLPGQLFHNIVSHGIARLAEFLDDKLTDIHATAHQSSQLANMGGDEILDELRVLIRDGNGTTAFFCFSTQLRPGVNQLRIYGPANSLVVDYASGSIFRKKNRSFKSYVTYFAPHFFDAWENLRNAESNISNFLRRRLYQDAGLTELIKQLYRSIIDSVEPPIPYGQILLTARIMDEIFSQIYSPPPIEQSEILTGAR